MLNNILDGPHSGAERAILANRLCYIPSYLSPLVYIIIQLAMGMTLLLEQVLLNSFYAVAGERSKYLLSLLGFDGFQLKTICLPN